MKHSNGAKQTFPTTSDHHDTIRFDDLDDLLPSEYQDPWPPSDEDIDEMEKQADWEDLQRSIPDAPERNRNLK